jgi:hypothetical protein
MSSTATLMEDSMSSTTLSALSDSITPSEPSVRSESSRASEPPEESNFSVILDFGESISSEQLSAMDEVDKLVQDQTGKLATPNHDYPDDEDLSPERIDEILIRAAARLREQRNLLQRISPAHKCLPKVDSGSLPTPYMRSTKGIVRLEPKSLVSEEQRRLANNPRSVEDPISLQVRAKSKGLLARRFPIPSPNDEILPFFFLDVAVVPVLGVAPHQ